MAAVREPLAPLDVARIRADFPVLSRRINGHPLAYLDNAASAQQPSAVIDAVADYARGHHANVHRGVHTLSQEATALYEGAREKARGFVNAASPAEIVFVRGTTESRAPVCAASSCQGTMFEWCSSCETTISSPAASRARPCDCATRLIASVVPRTNTISAGEAALTKRRAFSRAPS